MSILINMEMPKNCCLCPCSDLEYYDCNLMPGTGISSDRKSGKRLDDCPLIPVPDHGRLIDADEIIPQLLEAENGATSKSLKLAIAMLKGFIEDTMTVIPADKDGET